MNTRQLEERIGESFRLRPTPRQVDPGGVSADCSDDFWRLEKVADAPARLVLRNTRSGRVVELQNDNVREYRSPDFILLRCQITLLNDLVQIEPILVGAAVGPPAERSFCPDRGLVQSVDWDHVRLGGADIAIPWDDSGWERIQAVAKLTVLVNAPPGTSPIAHLRIVDVASGAPVAEQAVREIRSAPNHIEYQGVNLAVPRARGTHSYRLQFRTEEKAAISVNGPITFTIQA